MKYTWFFVLLLVLVGCKDDDDSDTPSPSPNIRQVEIERIVNNQIVADFNTAEASAKQLAAALSSLRSNPSPAQLAVARNSWTVAAADWMELTSTQVGEAKFTFLYSRIYSFPIDTTRLLGLSDVESDTTTILNAPSSTKGFAAVEYLLFGRTPTEQLSFLAEDYRMDYLAATGEVLHQTVDELNHFWVDEYSTEFAQNSATGTAEPVSLLFNGILTSLENMKAYELGEPLGLNGTNPNSELLIAPFSNESKVLMKRQIEGIYQLFGTDNGYATMVRSMNLTHSNALADQVDKAFITTLDQIDQTPLDWNQAVRSNNAELLQLHDDVKELIRLLKTDVSSHLSITITLSDSDGD